MVVTVLESNLQRYASGQSVNMHAGERVVPGSTVAIPYADAAQRDGSQSPRKVEPNPLGGEHGESK